MPMEGMHTKHRWAGRAAVAALLAVTLTGCFGPKDTGGDQQTIDGADKPTTISIWRTFDGPEIFQPVIDEFEQDNPNIDIEYRVLPAAEFELVTSEALAAGEGPDIWAIRNDWLPRHQAKLVPMPDGLIADEGSTDEDELKKLFAPIVATDVVRSGKIYGLPYYVDTLGIWKNDAVFETRIDELEAAGSDDDAEFLRGEFNTWDKLQRAVELLTKRDGSGNIQISGLAAGTSNNIARPEDVVYGMMLQNGTQMVSPEQTNATFHLGSKDATGQTRFLGTEALTRYTAFADPARPYYSWNDRMPGDVAAFIDGKAAMIFGFQYYEMIFKQTAPTLSYSANPFPQVRDTDTPVDYPSYYVETVTKNADNPDLAWKVLKNLTIDRGSAYRSATKRPNPEPTAEPPSVIERGDTGLDPFEYQQQTAKDWYKTKRPDKVDTIFKALINAVAVERQSPQNAIEGAAKQVSEILQSEGEL